MAPAAVTYIWLQHRKAVVRKEVKWKMIAGIDKSQLVFFTFSQKESQTKLKWKHSKEFEFNGEMYDVVKKITSTDSIQYWCWWDHEETKLSKQLSKLLVGAFQSDVPSKDKKQQIVSFYKSLFCSEVFSWNPIFNTFRNSKNAFFYDNYKFIATTINAPPPELV
jgi:hypothetical protein